MTVTEHPAHHLAKAKIETLGVPGADGRWQPTRAGAINSWAWAEETLLFADGWLALAGPNGSGKSLTASMLITVLLDADTTQTALSVSGKAAGTLISRHTDRREREDRTGVWWLEYGHRNPDDGQINYLTTGLWLRATGGELQRTFFIAPGRVGHELTLQVDRETLRIAELAELLAAQGGELFTSSTKLRPKVLARFPAVGDERDYRQAVRTRLFAPLDEVQFDALLGVLRSLRSLRTAEAISPNQMRATLTDALPALDPDRLTVIADSMERIAELERQLQRTHEEASLLEETDKLYGRYVIAVARIEAAQLSAAHHEFNDFARQTREATAELESAKGELSDAKAAHNATRLRITKLEGRREAADAALRDHAGAELPHMEQRAADLAVQAEQAGERAVQVADDAAAATDSAAESTEAARIGQRHLAELSDELRRSGASLGAQAALERLIVCAEHLSTTAPAAMPDLELEQVCATPLVWSEARREQIRRVQSALRTHQQAQQTEQSVAADRRRAEDKLDTCRDQAEQATVRRQETEATLVTEVTAWASSAHQLGPVPDELLALDDSTEDRLDLDQLMAWLDRSANTARAVIDLSGHQKRAETAEALAAAARRTAQQLRTVHANAHTAEQAAATVYNDTRRQAQAEDADAERQAAQARSSHEEQVTAAQSDITAAQQRLDDGTTAADQAAQEWISEVHRWREILVHLPADTPALPMPDADHEELSRVDPAPARLEVEQAHAIVSARLARRVEGAEQKVDLAADAVAAAEAELADARRAAPTPAAPAWRHRRPEDGTPMWALVDFAEDLPADQADRLEGALLVAGLLDALVNPEGHVVAGDLTITAETTISDRGTAGLTLADLLRVEQDPDIGAERVAGILRAIPVDTPGSSIGAGLLSTGVLTASAPPNYRARFIGRTARERARLDRVRDLERTLDEAQSELAATRRNLHEREQDVRTAADERDAFPPADRLRAARDQKDGLRLALHKTRQQADADIARAGLILQQSLAALETAAVARAANLAAVQQQWHHAKKTAEEADVQAQAAETTAAEQAETTRHLDHLCREAAAAQREADTQHQRFPHTAVAQARTDHLAEDQAEAELTRAQVAVVDAAEHHGDTTKTVKRALRMLNQAAALPDGTLLPTDHESLDENGEHVGRLGHQVELWKQAAIRTAELLNHAARDASRAAAVANRATRTSEEASRAKLTAAKQAAAVQEARELYGAEYEQLRLTRQQIGDELHTANEQAEQHLAGREAAAGRAATAQATLDGIAPQREATEQHRDGRLRKLGRLVDEGLADVPDDLPTDSTGRPANLTAGLIWARRLLNDQPAGPDRLNSLTRSRDRALTTLENNVRRTGSELSRFNRQVTLQSVAETEWRRAIVADPDAVRGEDLRPAVQTLRATAAQLEADLRDDVKQTMKTGLFTQLRRDIQLRREAAQELVNRIHTTLERVRTGVANVGIQVAWDVRADEDAQRMVNLISQPPSDEVFEQMYTVLRQRMDDSVGDTWADRVAHTFDYRAWHDWEISVTHTSFSDGSGTEKFRKVEARSNPLDTLSTGERRLATMLPLLAAAWSMYSGDYRGPRLVSIDEIDAAFDEPNLRQVLELLRDWEFDVLATTPSMTPLIKREAKRAMVHQVITTGRHRVTVPWLWEGYGEPEPLTLDLSPDQAREQQ